MVLSPQGQFGDSLEDIAQLVEQLDFLNCNTVEIARELELGIRQDKLRELLSVFSPNHRRKIPLKI